MAKEAPAPAPPRPVTQKNEGTKMVAGHFKPIVARTLLMARSQTGLTLKQTLGQAINDYCAKLGLPQPYDGEE